MKHYKEWCQLYGRLLKEAEMTLAKIDPLKPSAEALDFVRDHIRISKDAIERLTQDHLFENKQRIFDLYEPTVLQLQKEIEEEKEAKKQPAKTPKAKKQPAKKLNSFDNV